MDTAFEALMRSMLNNGWFTKSDGDVESPFGYFGYVSNTTAELPEIYDAFHDIIGMYGMPDDKDMVGSFIAYINSDGNITIERMHLIDAELWYRNTSRDYTKWGIETNDPNVVPPF